MRPFHVLFLLSIGTSAFLPDRQLLVTNNAAITATRDRRTSLPSASATHLPDANDDDQEFVRSCLRENALFNNLPRASLAKLVENFETFRAKAGDVIIRQGDPTSDGFVYLVGEGACRVIVDGAKAPHPYGILGPRKIFGELGVLYEESRAATIAVESEALLCYRIPGRTFNKILRMPAESLPNMQDIDKIINQVSGTQSLYGGDVLLPYKPERIWLWSQFEGSLFRTNLRTTMLGMLASVAFCVYARHETGSAYFTDPDTSIPFVHRLSHVGDIWKIQQGLTTFVLTFFVNQSFAFWRDFYKLSREVQSHLNNFNLLAITNTRRSDDGNFDQDAREFLADVGQYTRLYHVLMWASKAERFSALATPAGLARMESRGLMTARQLECITSMNLTKNRLYHAPLGWMMIRSNKAMADGVLAGDTATKGVLLKETMKLRMTARRISDRLSGRMPLAYVQLVQVLVDTFVLASPVALFSDLGEYSVFAVGLVAVFYTGLNNLGKIFLDPLNNEKFCDNSIYMDLGVLVRESNEVSTQWLRSTEKLPY